MLRRARQHSMPMGRGNSSTSPHAWVAAAGGRACGMFWYRRQWSDSVDPGKASPPMAIPAGARAAGWLRNVCRQQHRRVALTSATQAPPAGSGCTLTLVNAVRGAGHDVVHLVAHAAAFGHKAHGARAVQLAGDDVVQRTGGITDLESTRLARTGTAGQRTNGCEPQAAPGAIGGCCLGACVAANEAVQAW